MKTLTPIAALVLMVLVLAGCSSMPGKTVRESADDARITTAVKARLAADKLATLSGVTVETNLRTVYLTGMVDSEEAAERAAEIAWSVEHVNGVVNHLAVQKRG